MSKKLQPICFYVNDREEMINQMFSTVKEDKLRAMLPPVLKGLPMSELKSSCLEELLGISSKRIKSIIAGRELQSSSDSEDFDQSGSDNPVELSSAESDSNDDDPSAARCPSQDTRSGDGLQIAISSEEIDVLEDSNSPVPKTKSHNTATVSGTKPVKLKRLLAETEAKQSPAAKLRLNKPSASNGHAPFTEEAVPSNGRTLLEIVELELRARAIRAALTHQEKILEHREGADTGIVIDIKGESEKSAIACASNTADNKAHSSLPGMSKETGQPSTEQGKISQSNEKRPAREQSHSEENVSKKENSLEIVCEEISSDEAIFDDVDDAEEEPELIEPVIESIVISSDSEPEKIVEKQQSWKERWLEKKDIASVMKASKLITNVKRKMKHNKTNKMALAKEVKEQEAMSTHHSKIIQGTVSEFNLLTTGAVPLTKEVEQTFANVITITQQISEKPTQLPQIDELTDRQSPAEQVSTGLQHESKHTDTHGNLLVIQNIEGEAPVLVDETVSGLTPLATATGQPAVVDGQSGEQSQTTQPETAAQATTEQSHTIRQEHKSSVDDLNIEQTRKKKCKKRKKSREETSQVQKKLLPSSTSYNLDKNLGDIDSSPVEQSPIISSTDLSTARESIQDREHETVETSKIRSPESSRNSSTEGPKEIEMSEPEERTGSPGPAQGLSQQQILDEQASRHSNDDADKGGETGT